MQAVLYLVLTVSCLAVSVGCHAQTSRELDLQAELNQWTHNDRHELIWLPSLENESKHEWIQSGFPSAEHGVLINEIGEVLFISNQPQIVLRDIHSTVQTAILKLPDLDKFAIYSDGAQTELPSFCYTSSLPRHYISFTPRGTQASGRRTLRKSYSRIPMRTEWILLDECLNPVQSVDDIDSSGIMFDSTTLIPGIDLVFDLYEDRNRFRHKDGTLSEPFWMTIDSPLLTLHHRLLFVYLDPTMSKTAWYDPQINRMIPSNGGVAAATQSLIVETTKDGSVITDRYRSFKVPFPEDKRFLGSTEADLILCNDKTTRGLNRGPVYCFQVLDGLVVPYEHNILDQIERVYHQRWIVGRNAEGVVQLLDSELNLRMSFDDASYPYYVTREGTVAISEHDGSKTKYRLVDRTGRCIREFHIEELLTDSTP